MPCACRSRSALGWILLLIVATLITFGPTVRCGFTDWDDPDTIWSNPHLRQAVSLSKLGYFWKHAEGELFIPVTYTAWGLLTHVGESKPAPNGALGPDPAVFHGASVVLHLLAAVVVFLILRRMVRHDSAAGAAALLFALHPVQAEAVAWASGLKDVLCGLFVVVAVWQYLLWLRPDDDADERDARHGSRWHYVVAILAMMLGLLSKPTAVVTPLLLLVIDVIVVRRPVRAAAKSLWPFVLLSVPCVIWTRAVQPAALGARVALWAKPIVALDAVAFYLRKIVWPVSLGIDYGRDPATALASRWVWLMCLIPVTLAVIAWKLRRRAPLMPAGAIAFVVGVLPVLGFVSFEFQTRSTVADHYLYPAMFGVALLAAWCVRETASRNPRATFYATAVLLGALGLRSLDQTRYWIDSRALFARAIEVNPRSYDATTDLASIVSFSAQAHAQAAQVWSAQHDDNEAAKAAANSNAEYKQAVQLYTRALELKPDAPIALQGRAILRASFGHHRDAIADLEAIIRTLPSLRFDEHAQFTRVYVDLGREWMKAGEPDKAVECFDAFLKIKPGDLGATRGRESALAMSKKVTPAAVGPTTKQTLYSGVGEDADRDEHDGEK